MRLLEVKRIDPEFAFTAGERSIDIKVETAEIAVRVVRLLLKSFRTSTVVNFFRVS